MVLYFVRHAIAEEQGDWTGDEDSRPLTREGVEKMEQAAAGLRIPMKKVELVCSSPLVRSRQTAEILVRGLGQNVEISIWEELRPNAKPEDLEKKITALDCSSIALVGHQPHLGIAVSYFLTGRRVPLQIDFKKGAVCSLQYEGEVPAVLNWFLPPKIASLMSR